MIGKWSVWIKLFVQKIINIILSPLIFISKKLVIPGFQGVPLYDVAVFFVHGAKKSSLSLRANALTFSFILAFVPAVIFLFTLIPLFPITGLRENVLLTLEQYMPKEAFITIRNTIEDILTNQRKELISISFLIMLYFASNGLISIMNAFNHSSHAVETRSNLQKRLVSLLLVLILSLTFIIFTAVNTATSLFFYYIEEKGIIPDMLNVYLVSAGNRIITLTMLLIAFSSIYYLAPAKRGSFPFFSAGSVVAAVLAFLTFEIFSFFVDTFGTYNRFYGSLGTIVVILIWINITALMLLIGFELNASIYVAKRRSKIGQVSDN